MATWVRMGRPSGTHTEPPAERVQQELDEVLGTAPIVCYEDRERLPFTRAVLHEAQRLSSVVAVGAVRQCVTSTRLHGYSVPKVGGPAEPRPPLGTCNKYLPAAAASASLPAVY